MMEQPQQEEIGSDIPIKQHVVLEHEEAGWQLPIKRQAFCREYLVDRNATQAAVRAGYSVKTARQQAAQIMANEAVRVFLNNLMHLREQSLQESAEYVVNSLRDIVGNAVASGNHREALRGLELLGKHYRLFTDDAQRTRYPMTDKRFS
jgi:membrane carboxypeptidase/penicillin-binding protein